jgi:hypothetical protein
MSVQHARRGCQRLSVDFAPGLSSSAPSRAHSWLVSFVHIVMLF